MTARRRQSSTKPVRARIHDAGIGTPDPATVKRLELLETSVQSLEDTVQLVAKRVAALQAHMDHLAARLLT